MFLGFPGGSAGKESTYNVGDLGSIPGLERSPGEGNGYPLQYSGLENSMDCTVRHDKVTFTKDIQPDLWYMYTVRNDQHNQANEHIHHLSKLFIFFLSIYFHHFSIHNLLLFRPSSIMTF